MQPRFRKRLEPDHEGKGGCGATRIDLLFGISLDAGISHRVYSRQATIEYARRFLQYDAGWSVGGDAGYVLAGLILSFLPIAGVLAAARH